MFFLQKLYVKESPVQNTVFLELFETTIKKFGVNNIYTCSLAVVRHLCTDKIQIIERFGGVQTCGAVFPHSKFHRRMF